MTKRISVTQENDTGWNQQFRDNVTGQRLSRPELVHSIEQGKYPHYHVRVIQGVKTPVSNPDRSEGNNLG